jgi:hypothetical protein
MRRISTAAMALLALLGIASIASPARAEIVEGVTTYWGVSGMITGTTTDDIDSEVWAIEQIGNRVYVGGRFTHVTNDGQSYERQSIAAFNASTGVWIDTWTPNLNGGVYALQASSDGSRLFVGGDFSEYNGINVKGLAALDPMTGAIDWTFGARVSGGSQPSVKTLDIEGDWLYVGGQFDALKTSGVGPDLSNAGRVSQTTGVVDASFTPDVIGGGVWGIDASPTSTNVYLAGNFDSVAGQAGTIAFAAVNDAGTPVPTGFQSNNTSRNYMQDVETVNGLVFIGGSQHVLTVYNEADWSVVVSHTTNGDYHALATFNDPDFGGSRSVRGDGIWNNISINTSSIKVADGYTANVCTGEDETGTCRSFTGFHPTFDATFDDNIGSIRVTRNEPGPDGRGGDYQDIEVVGDRVYASCHCWGDHWSSNSVRDWTSYDTPEGTWNDAQWIHAYSATTGEFIETFKSGSTNSGAGPWAIHGTDNGCLWFGGGVTGSGGQPADGFVRLCDGDLDTTSPSTVTGFAAVAETADSVDLAWNAATDDVSVLRYDVFDNDSGGIVATSITATATIMNLEPLVDHAFYVKAIDEAGNYGDRSNIVTVNLGAVDSPTNCVATNVGTAASITWDPVTGADDYRISRSVGGGTFYWQGVTALSSFDDTLRTSGIHTFAVQARIAEGDWSAASTCEPALDPTDGLLGASAPVSCSATAAGLAATVSWDPASNANDYRVYRSIDASLNYWRALTTGLTVDDTLRSSGVHTYLVQARGDDGVWSDLTTCAPPLDTTPAPVLAPSACVASNVATAASLSWDASAGAADYRIRRSIDGGSSYWRGLSPTTTFSDTLRSSGLHSYFISARAAGGAWSAETECAPTLNPADGLLVASPPPSCMVSVDDLAATIVWEAAENGIDYRVYRSVNGGTFYWRGLTIDLFLEDTLVANATHVYQVQARGEDGTWSAPITCVMA